MKNLLLQPNFFLHFLTLEHLEALNAISEQGSPIRLQTLFELFLVDYGHRFFGNGALAPGTRHTPLIEVLRVLERYRLWLLVSVRLLY